MTKPSDEQIKGALKWTEDFILSHISEDEADDVERAEEVIKVLRTALEEYGKPKTVTREWVDLVIEMLSPPVYIGHKTDYFIGRLKEQGIEVTGNSPDDKS